MLSVVAVCIGIFASSFSKANSSKAVAEEWFIYVGGPLNDPSSYTYNGSDPGCSSTDELCAIKVMNNNGQPDADALQELYDDNNQFIQPVAGVVEFRAAP